MGIYRILNTMKQTLNKLLDLLFPPRAAQLILRTHKKTSPDSPGGCHEGIFYCANYTHPVIHAAVSENKFHNNSQAQTLLANTLTTWIDQKKLGEVCFIPIPLGKNRQHKRGHNQVISVLNRTSYDTEHVLTRVTETVPQVSLGRHQRLQNIKGVFQCDVEALLKVSGKTLILLDDVVTTGATLAEARAVLTPHLPPDTRLLCLGLAH